MGGRWDKAIAQWLSIASPSRLSPGNTGESGPPSLLGPRRGLLTSSPSTSSRRCGVNGLHHVRGEGIQEAGDKFHFLRFWTAWKIKWDLKADAR